MALGANGEPRLLLPLAPVDAPISIDGGDALSVSIVSFKYSGQILSFLDLICLNADLEASEVEGAALCVRDQMETTK